MHFVEHFQMAMFAAGLCAPGCGAMVSALAGGPMLGAMSVAAAIGYGIYSFTNAAKEDEGDDLFADAVDGDETKLPNIRPVVQVAVGGGKPPETRLAEGESQKSFL